MALFNFDCSIGVQWNTAILLTSITRKLEKKDVHSFCLNFKLVFFRLKIKSVLGFKIIVMFFKKVGSLKLFFTELNFTENFVKLSYPHKSNCYSQCRRDMNKVIAFDHMNTSLSKEFDLKYQIT